MVCPICAKDPAPRYRPFCSRRCADIDLAHWFRGSYAIPTPETETDDQGPDEDAPQARATWN